MAVVLFHLEVAAEFGGYDKSVQDEVMKYVVALRALGPTMGEPSAKTLNGSKYAKMKELRPTVNKVEWRIAFAFDSEQQGILLAGGSKNGVNQDRFYKTLIQHADRRLEDHELELSKRSKVQQAAARGGAGPKGGKRK